MENKTNDLDTLVNKGYFLDIGKILDVSFLTFKKSFLYSTVGFVLLCIISLFIFGGIFGLAYGFTNFTETMLQFETLSTEPVFMLVNLILSSVISALSAPIVAGFIHINHLAKTNQDLGISVFFDFYKPPYFKNLFLSYLLIGFLKSIINIVLVSTDLAIFDIVFQIVIGLFSVFTIPLIIYKNLNYIDAIRIGIQLFLKQPFHILVAMLLGVIFALLGLLGLCIGIFFTFSYIYSINYAIYHEAVGFEEKSIIDEIGIE